jgi:transposase
MATIKVFDPISVPVSILHQLQDLNLRVDQVLHDNERLRADNERLRADNERLQRELEQVRSQLDEARRASKRQAAPFRKGPPKLHPKKPGRKAGDLHGTHAHRLPPPLEHISEILEAPLPEACPHCGGTLCATDTTSQFQTEIPRQPIRREFRIHVGCCQGCGRRVQGRHPLQTSDATGAAASQLGPDAQAAVVTLNKEAGLSHGKISHCLDTLFGIDLTRGASAQIVLRAAERLAPAHQEIVTEIQNAEQLWVDETGWRLGGQPSWLHVWVSERATCYQVAQGRSAAVLEKVLGSDWAGVLIHDGLASYDRFTEALHQQCLFHVLRRARELAATARGGAVRFPRQVIDLFTGAIHLRNEYLAGRVLPAVWESARDVYEIRLLQLLDVERVNAENARLSKHLDRHFVSWFPFLTNEDITPTNAVGEQAVRPAVVNRKVWGGNRTPAGAQAQGVLSSVLRTCQQQAKIVVDFLSATLRSFGNPLLPRPILLDAR